MRYPLKPSVSQLSRAFPALLIGLPMTLSALCIHAAEEKPGAVLPPPSLYEAVPGQPRTAPPPVVASPTTPPVTVPQETAQSSAGSPPATTSSTVAPAPTTTATTATPAPVVTTPAPTPAPVATMPAPQSQRYAVAPAEPRRPWYKRWFGWMIPSRKHDTAVHTPEEPATVVGAPVVPAGRNQYAYDSPNRTIRTGMLGQCVRTGAWAEAAAGADCDSGAVANQEPTRVASAPPVRTVRPEPVEVVPLPPKPPAANEEHALPAPDFTKEEIITALAETHINPEPDFDKLTLSAGALFPLSSAAIKSSGHEKLDELAAKLKAMKFQAVDITGYTDPTGSARKNLKLSKARAESVKKYLVAKGIDAKRIRTSGKGGNAPLAKSQNCDALSRADKIICYAPDRRVEVNVVGGKPRG